MKHIESFSSSRSSNFYVITPTLGVVVNADVNPNHGAFSPNTAKCKTPLDCYWVKGALVILVKGEGMKIEMTDGRARPQRLAIGTRFAVLLLTLHGYIETGARRHWRFLWDTLFRRALTLPPHCAR